MTVRKVVKGLPGYRRYQTVAVAERTEGKLSLGKCDKQCPCPDDDAHTPIALAWKDSSPPSGHICPICKRALLRTSKWTWDGLVLIERPKKKEKCNDSNIEEGHGALEEHHHARPQAPRADVRGGQVLLAR